MLWEQENGGGGSYYINEHGRSINTMPWRFDEFYQWTKALNFDDFTFGS
jgi:4-hydroxyacetophenone monooxygenase